MMKALVVIDLQNGVCNPDFGVSAYSYKEVISNVNERIDFYRSTNQPIVFIQHTDDELKKGSDVWQFVPDLNVTDRDVIVEKSVPDSFYHTKLESVLNELGCDELEFAGAQTEYCVDTTIKVAFDKGYKLTMSQNLVTTTLDNEYMSASDTISFYRDIWDTRFLTFVK
ncbi:Isochorismatase [Weissella viridescens]|nr:Isochorismatase [Weissella viridescens]